MPWSSALHELSGWPVLAWRSYRFEMRNLFEMKRVKEAITKIERIICARSDIAWSHSIGSAYRTENSGSFICTLLVLGFRI
jgi:hypothetical protein